MGNAIQPNQRAAIFPLRPLQYDATAAESTHWLHQSPECVRGTGIDSSLGSANSFEEHAVET